MDDELKIKMSAFTLDCKDPHELAKFYATLLKWEIPFYNEEYVIMGAPGTNQGAYPGMTFQRNPDKTEVQNLMTYEQAPQVVIGKNISSY